MKLSKDKEYLVLDNQKLVYYLVANMGITHKHPDYDDITSDGILGLVKAAITYDETKGIKFTTYADRCIKNEIFQRFRKTRKTPKGISLDDEVLDADELSILDTIADPSSDFTEKIEVIAEFEEMINIALNQLNGKNRLVLLRRLAGDIQEDIGEQMGLSRSYISRVFTKAANTVKAAAQDPKSRRGVFSMEVVSNKYQISFSSRDIQQFNKIFATLLRRFSNLTEIPNFKVDCTREKIVVQTPANPESFAFIADIIEEIDDFSLSFSDKREGESSVKNSLPPKKPTINEPEEKPRKAPRFTTAVREYMLTLEEFTNKELRAHFPDFPPSAVSNALKLAKKANLIESIGRGEYKVLKS